MSSIDIHSVMRNLATRRPIFHSEADFQHALAWELHALDPSLEIRLEVPANYKSQSRAFIDLLARKGRTTIFFELKYRTINISIEHKGETFNLKTQGAQDQGSYDFLKDISRVESFVNSTKPALGYAIMLSNDRRYWTQRRGINPIDADFQLLDNRVLSGQLGWAAHAGVGSIKRRESPIDLERSYPIKWLPYSEIAGSNASQFRYLSLEVTAEGQTCEVAQQGTPADVLAAASRRQGRG
ncbi:hypothetical protein [Propionivibrio sp.]|uniref:hypothetical protein n=1 Tax=Propionivibrio sp. TaxID=2212460 RepID=UPI0039E2B8B5